MINVEEIKNKLDIVNLISEYLGPLTQAGSNYKCKCPFHNEKTPSFMVSPTLQIFKCFGCGIGGDVIKFIQEMDKVDFKEAVKIAAEKAGLRIDDFFNNPKLEQEKKLILQANELTAKFYNYILLKHKSGLSGMKYAQKRGMTESDINKFLVGYAPNTQTSLKDFLNKKGFDDKSLVKWGLLVERNTKYIDKFRNRLIQPIFNLKGDVIAFSGRYIGNSKQIPKYLNSPDTIVFKKSEVLYGLFHAKSAMKNSGFLIIEEGNIDVISSHRVGVENIAAPLGTAFTEAQAALVKKFVDTVYFCFDTDEAGQNALVRAISIAENVGLFHKVIDIGNYKDPDELISREPDKWIKCVNQASDSISYLINHFCEKYDVNLLENKNKLANFISPIISSLKNDISKSHYVKLVSSVLDIAPEVYASKYLQDLYKQNNKSSKNLNTTVTYQQNLKKSTIRLDREFYLLALLLKYKFEFVTSFNPDVFENTDLKIIFNFLVDIIKKGMNVEILLDSLDEDLKQIFYTLNLFDTSFVQDPKNEIKNTYKFLYKEYLKRTINQLSIYDDEETVTQINDLIKELKLLE